GFIDAYRRHRDPTAADLLNQLKNTAWTCASINASVCASFPPKLYVRLVAGQKALCKTRLLNPHHPLVVSHKALDPSLTVEEVAQHPIVDLFNQVNPVHNAFDLWELTQLYLEVHGSAFWLLDFGAFTVQNIWVLPSQNVKPCRVSGSS